MTRDDEHVSIPFFISVGGELMPSIKNLPPFGGNEESTLDRFLSIEDDVLETFTKEEVERLVFIGGFPMNIEEAIDAYRRDLRPEEHLSF